MICGDRLRLRGIDDADLPLLVHWRNEPDVYRHFFEHEPVSPAMQKRWFAHFLERTDEKYWIAETRAEPTPVGTIALIRLDWRSRKAELGRVLVYPAEHRSQGYGAEMCRLALGYAFGHLNLNRVHLDVYADNASAIALYEKLGFREEGRLRQHVFREGAYRDVLVFSLLADEFSG